MELIHDKLVSILWPGNAPLEERGYRDRRLLESAVARPFQSAFGEDAYPTLIEKAAALFQSLIANHPFGDGNKRTAIISLYAFLTINGLTSVLTNDALYELARRTASYKFRGLTADESLKEIFAALKGNIIPAFGVSGLPKK